MTRGRLIGLVVAALVAAVVAGAVIAAPSSGGSSFRVDVVFDDSRGLLRGQLVQIAGARVGTIKDVTLTRDFKARVHMDVDRRFAPFRRDAECTIRPQGLIAENYVECHPGSPDAPPLRGRDGTAPTVPVERTTQPVSLTDLFEIWDVPTRDRARVLLSTLGIATAARGADINAILRRANPALTLARRTISTLERQRDDLASIVDASDRVAGALAKRPEQLRELSGHAARVTTQTANERAALGEGVRRMPGLLRRARPALRRLDATMDAGQPLFDRLHEAAPAFNRVTGDVPRLARAAAPALAKLAPVLREGSTTARRSAPVLRLVEQYAASSLPTARVAGVLFSTLEDRGFPKNFLELTYNGALAAARHDDISHILPAHVTLSQCGQFATTPTPGCGSGETVRRERARPRAKKRKRPERRRPARRAERDRSQASPERPGEQERPRGDARPQDPRLPDLPKLPAPDLPDVPELPVPELPLPELPLPKGDQPPRAPGGGATDDLLDFLLG